MNITIYLPNPTKHNKGLGDIKSGDLVMVKREDWKNRKRYVVNGLGTHGSNGKVWNVDLIPESQYFKNTGKYGKLQEK